MNDIFSQNNSYIIGKAVIDDCFHTQSGDESFFRYFGNDVIYSIQRTVHEEDLSRFKAVLESIQHGEIKKIAVRMKGINAHYRWLLCSVKQLSSPDNEKHFVINISDIYSLESLLYEREYRLTEYRHILSLISNLLFEYSFETKNIKISLPDCYREITIINENLDAWQKKSIAEKLVHSRSTDSFNKLCDDIRNGNYRFEYEIETSLLTQGKTTELILFRGITRYDDLEHKKVTGVISAINSKYKTKEYNFTIEANRDSLTELLNKRAITSYAANILTSKPQYTVNLVLLEIDDFSEITSTYGHLFSDEVLFTTASIIKSELGNRGMAGRISNGGFLLVIEETADETDLRGILRAIRTKTEWAFTDRIENLCITCSMGISAYPVDSSNFDELFMQADKALFIAQKKGKNRYVIYDVEKHGSVQKDDKNKIAYLSDNKEGNKRINLIGNITDRLASGNTPDIRELLEEIRINFELDSAYIFEGSNMETLYCCGNDAPLTAEYIFNPQYNKRFNGDMALAIDNVNELEGRADEAFKTLTNQNILGAFQYLITDGTEIKGLISFNYKNRFKKWAVDDINYLTILCRIISAVINI